MMWRLRYGKHAVRQLSKLDKQQQILIQTWMGKRIDGCEDPRAHGKALVGSLGGFWRYRVGKYRVICEIRDEELIVLAVEVGHRSNVDK